MILTLVALTLLFVSAAFVVFYYLKIAFYKEKNKQHFLKIIVQARQLFEHLPQHRGIANAFLQGDLSFKQKLTEARNQIDRDITQLDLSLEGENPLVSRWRDINSRWDSLKLTLASLSPGESFQRHTELITELTYFIGDAAEASKVQDGKAYFHDLGDVVFHQLFWVMEFMGRARGVGMGVASVGKMSVANRVKLGFLHQRIEQTTALTQKTLGRILSKHTSLATQRVLVSEGQAAAISFSQLMKNELLEVKSIKIKPTDYYDSASLAIGKNLLLFDGLLPVIARVAEESQNKVTFQIRFFCVVAIVISLLLAWQWRVAIL